MHEKRSFTLFSQVSTLLGHNQQKCWRQLFGSCPNQHQRTEKSSTWSHNPWNPQTKISILTSTRVLLESPVNYLLVIVIPHCCFSLHVPTEVLKFLGIPITTKDFWSEIVVSFTVIKPMIMSLTALLYSLTCLQCCSAKPKT